VGKFALRTRGVPTSGPEASADWFERVRSGLPPRFEAVGEALASGSGSAEACAVAGAELARLGAPLDEAFEALRLTYELVLGTAPAYADLRAVGGAWSDGARQPRPCP
jgi:hypothetical protein